MSQKTKKGIMCIAGILLIGVIGCVFAYYQSSFTLVNQIKTGSVKVEFIEKFTGRNNWLPGETVNVKPYFRNRGNVAVFLRVKEEDRWEGNTEAEVGGVIKNHSDTWLNEWVSGSDGYYYYKKILGAGESTGPILESVRLSPSVSNDDHAADYSSLQYFCTYKAEAVQAEKEAIPDFWRARPYVSGTSVSWTFY